jgi:hypothetical protein
MEANRMTLTFPNRSRHYDATRRAVRFWGYDSAMETSFFVGEKALEKIQPNVNPSEAGFLGAFDSNRDVICEAAMNAYGRTKRGDYDLIPADF